MKSDTYAGKKACGCIVAACINRPECKDSIADTVADFIRNGLTVEYLPWEVVKPALLTSCPHSTADIIKLTGTHGGAA